MRLMRTPKKMDIAITNRCNLRCRYCYHFESAGDAGEDLSPGGVAPVLRGAQPLRRQELILAGGEPFIREDLKEIIEGIVRNRMRFAILSNGTLITDEMAAYLASTRRCEYVQVSIDGSVPNTHDACGEREVSSRPSRASCTFAQARRLSCGPGDHPPQERPRSGRRGEAAARRIRAFPVFDQFRVAHGSVPEKRRAGPAHAEERIVCHGDPS